MATLTYAYAESTAVVGPLAPAAEPHSWDLCDRHAEKITAPLGWEMLRVNHIEIDDDEDLTALAEAVREAGRVTSGLVEDDHDFDEFINPGDPADPASSNHPVLRTKRVAEAKELRRGHLRLVTDNTVDNGDAPDTGESTDGPDTPGSPGSPR